MEQLNKEDILLHQYEQFKANFKELLIKLGIKVKKEETHKLMCNLRDYKINIKNINPVRHSSDEENTFITVFNTNQQEDLVAVIKKNISPKDTFNYSITEEELILTSENYPYDTLLKKLFPDDFDEVPGGYEIIGKIAHLNLREKFYPHKKVIGKAILDKNPAIRTVINKTSKIDNIFRTYEMEVLAGEESFWVSHVEGGCKFEFDIRRVYWCSRLQHERDRMLRTMKKGEVLCDAFCGVGPLSVRAAKKGIRVLANDLNPYCYDYINENIKRNKLTNGIISTFNMDAREFIRKCVYQLKNYKDEDEIDERFPKDVKIDHVYMNLPKDAIEFLDVFIGLFNNTKYDKYDLPTVHVYGFSNAKDPKLDLLGRMSCALGYKEDTIDSKYITNFEDVRDISTNKRVYCISFKIPPEVGYK